MLRTTEGERPVHVIYRRVDDEWLDPVHFRPDSLIGVAGVVNAARANTVTIANALGNGVADDKLIYTFVPDLIRYYRNEEPILQNVETYRLDDPEIFSDVITRLHDFVVKPVDGSGGKGIVIGPQTWRPILEGSSRSVRWPSPRCPLTLTARLLHATWTCVLLPSMMVATCGCCPADSLAWRCPKAPSL
jgi:uncharacterized circularly permuted ATP-grasp superfamily protein